MRRLRESHHWRQVVRTGQARRVDGRALLPALHGDLREEPARLRPPYRDPRLYAPIARELIAERLNAMSCSGPVLMRIARVVRGSAHVCGRAKFEKSNQVRA